MQFFQTGQPFITPSYGYPGSQVPIGGVPQLPMQYPYPPPFGPNHAYAAPGPAVAPRKPKSTNKKYGEGNPAQKSRQVRARNQAQSDAYNHDHPTVLALIAIHGAEFFSKPNLTVIYNYLNDHAVDLGIQIRRLDYHEKLLEFMLVETLTPHLGLIATLHEQGAFQLIARRRPPFALRGQGKRRAVEMDRNENALAQGDDPLQGDDLESGGMFDQDPRPFGSFDPCHPFDPFDPLW
jgi:hypothetical protein